MAGSNTEQHPRTGSTRDQSFKANSFEARLGAVCGSDIGHFDVPDVTKVLPEAYELVEDKLINEQDFRDFVFVNPAKLWASDNPDFFKGTVVETQVKEMLAG